MRNKTIFVMFLLACILSFFFSLKEVYAIAKTSSSAVVNTFTVQETATVTYKYTYVDEHGVSSVIQPDINTIEFVGTVINLQPIQISQPYAYIQYIINGQDYTGNTYTISNNTVIEQVYHEVVYTLHFESDGGTTYPDRVIFAGQPIGNLPTPIKESCLIEGTGTYDERACSYGFEFVGWYTDSGFTNAFDPTSSPTGDVTVYALWNGIYYYYNFGGQYEFDGVDDILNSHVRLLNEENIDRDFDLTFEIISEDVNYNKNSGKQQPTIMNAKNEGNNTYPGFVARNNTGDSTGTIHNKGRFSSNSSGFNNSETTVLPADIPLHYHYKRRNGLVTLTVTSNGEVVNNIEDKVVYDQNSSQIAAYRESFTYSDIEVTFGDATKNGQPMGRYWKGTLADMKVVVYKEGDTPTDE